MKSRSFRHVFVSCLMATVAIGLAACSGKEDVPRTPTAAESRADTLNNSKANQELQDKLTQSRSNALNNVTENATTYLGANPRFTPIEDWKVIPHTDDYIQDDCLSGSGWGWANVMNPKLKDDAGQPTKVKVFCSTVSPDLGCYKESDFAASPHAPKAKKCDKTLPFPIKRIGG